MQHGETTDNVSGRLGGDSDLTEKGWTVCHPALLMIDALPCQTIFPSPSLLPPVAPLSLPLLPLPELLSPAILILFQVRQNAGQVHGKRAAGDRRIVLQIARLD